MVAAKRKAPAASVRNPGTSDVVTSPIPILALAEPVFEQSDLGGVDVGAGGKPGAGLGETRGGGFGTVTGSAQ